MKKDINLRIALVALAAAVSLWAGYAIGYHGGVRDERREWWSSAHADGQGNLLLHSKAIIASEPFFKRKNSIPDK